MNSVTSFKNIHFLFSFTLLHALRFLSRCVHFKGLKISLRNAPFKVPICGDFVDFRFSAKFHFRSNLISDFISSIQRPLVLSTKFTIIGQKGGIMYAQIGVRVCVNYKTKIIFFNFSIIIDLFILFSQINPENTPTKLNYTNILLW